MTAIAVSLAYPKFIISVVYQKDLSLGKIETNHAEFGVWPKLKKAKVSFLYIFTLHRKRNNYETSLF